MSGHGLMFGFGLLAVSFTVPPVAQRAITLDEIVENVRQNEKLYQDIEVVTQEAYDIGDRKPAQNSLGNTVIRSQVKTRYVSQGDWFRLEMNGSTQNSKEVTSPDRIRAFDGETTRILEQNAVGNIARERLEDENFVRPHMLLIRHMRLPVPLSVYLSGHKAIQAYPGVAWQKDKKLQVTYQGEEMLDGLRCHKVRVDELVENDYLHNGREFWLAEDRNYLPLKQLAYTYHYSKQVPVGQAVVHDLKEIKPSIWFPVDVLYTAYNKRAIQEKGLQELQWERRYIVQSVDLEPQYDRDFFSRVEFPDGTAMYEVKDNKILRSWRVGPADAPLTEKNAVRYWWLLWLNLAVIVALVVFLVIWKRASHMRRLQ